MTDIFCTQYQNWKEQGTILFENKHAYAILSVTPAVPGHAMIIPKRHITDESEFQGQELKDLFIAIKETDTILKSMTQEQLEEFYKDLKQNPQLQDSERLAQQMLDHTYMNKQVLAFNIGINRGKAAGQSIDHYHIHLFPIRSEGKGVVKAIRELHSKQ